MDRRNFLKFSSAAGLFALGGGAALAPLTSHAQSTEYRALVCVFLFGGNDGLNMVVPMDSARYGQYSAVRKTLAIPQGALAPLSADYGLHPGLQALATGAWADNALALMHNVGPLARPMTQAQYNQWRASSPDSQFIPESLFSHSDQQTLWQNGASSTFVRTGWGGRAAERIDTPQVLSFAGNSRFGGGDLYSSLVLPGPGGGFGLNGFSSGTEPTRRRAALEALIGSASANAMHAAFAGQQGEALEASTRLSGIVRQRPSDTGANAAISNAFGNLGAPNNGRLSQQLYQVAKMIDQRASVGGNRHIYFVSLGGFDTHGNQIAATSLEGQHAALMAELGHGLSNFYAALKAIGMQNNVTAFTASDFGRTFKPNDSSGTDHAWGNEQLVLGGAVDGHKSFGIYPSLQLGGPDDAADPGKSWEHQGRWIPSTSVEQYGATLLRWMGLTDAQLAAVFPNLPNFSVKNLGFMKS